MQKNKKVIIIGAGFGGLATAALLAKDGYAVTVLEKNEQLGGRAGRIKKKGFTFDIGPSWYMMPDVFERFFAQLGKKPQDLLDLIKVAPQYRIFFSDKTSVDITDDLAQTKKTFEKLEPGSATFFTKYLQEAKFKYELSVGQVLYKNVDHVWDFFSWQLVLHGLRLNPFTSMQSYVQRFFKSEKVQQIIQYTLVFLGGAPSNMPAMYSLMSHVDFNLGTYYPMGGFYSLVEVMAAIGTEQGVTFRKKAPVKTILISEGKVTGVELENGEKIPADVVVSNADYSWTEDALSDQSARSISAKAWQKKVLAPSAFLIFTGVKGKLPKLAHHNIFFGKNWVEHFETIFSKPSWPKTPSIYINKPSATDPSVAPKGHENLMILVPIAPYLEETATSKRRYADYIYGYLEKELGLSIKKKLVVEELFSVSDFSSRYNSLGGNALGGLAHTLFQTGPWRAPNISKKLPNLIFAGANTVPGIGVPSAIISAQLAVERVHRLFGDVPVDR